MTRGAPARRRPAGATVRGGAAAATAPAGAARAAAAGATVARARSPAPPRPPAAAPPAARRRGYRRGSRCSWLSPSGRLRRLSDRPRGRRGRRGGRGLHEHRFRRVHRLSFPAGWKRVSEEPRVPGMRFGTRLCSPRQAPARTPRRRARPGAARRCSPRAARAACPAARPRPSRCAWTTFRRSATGARAAGLDGELQLYAVPTTRGVATVACTAPAGARSAAFRRDCENVAATLGCRSRRLPARPAPGVRAQSPDARRDEQAPRPGARSGSAGADTPDAQADALSTLAGFYRRAARTWRAPRSAPPTARPTSLAAALERTRLGLRERGGRGAGGRRAAYAEAGEREQGGERGRARAGQLEQLGYVFT